MLDLLVAIDLQLLAKGYFTDQNDLTCLFAARIVHGEISAVTDGFVESICEIETISEQSSASVLAVDNLHAFCEDANEVLNRGAVEEQLLLCYIAVLAYRFLLSFLVHTEHVCNEKATFVLPGLSNITVDHGELLWALVDKIELSIKNLQQVVHRVHFLLLGKGPKKDFWNYSNLA